MPSILLVPTELEAIALQYTTQITPAAGANVAPQWMTGLTVIAEPRSDAATNGTTAWYLAASPSVVQGLLVGFLSGNQTPTLVRVEGTNILGIEWGIFLDVGTKFVDHRGWFRQRGAQFWILFS